MGNGSDMSRDDCTCIAGARALARTGKAGLAPRDAFVTNFAQLRSVVRFEAAPGVVAVAIGPRCEWLGHLFLPAVAGERQVAIVGRHHLADLVVPSEFDAVSLRHVALLVRPGSGAHPLLRVLDLATATGFLGEQREPLRAIRTAGSLFIYLGDVLLMLLSTAHALDWDLDAAAVFAQIPARLYEVSADNCGAGKPPSQATADSDSEVTHVKVVGGPLVAGEDLRSIDPSAPGVEHAADTLALLRICDGRDIRFFAADLRSLDRGILFGRYARCNFALEHDSRISRVHLLLVRDGDDVLAIDTASTNGTLAGDEEFKACCVVGEQKFLLSGDVQLVWQPQPGARQGS